MLTHPMTSKETSQVPVEYGNRTLLKHVVLRSDIPQGYKKFTVNLNHPKEWIPIKRCTEEDSIKMKEELRVWFESTGLFALPGMETRFEHCDVGNFGGPARIVPGTNYEGSKIIHKFWTAFALWDDLLEQDLDEGKQSISKIRELLQQKAPPSSSHDEEHDLGLGWLKNKGGHWQHVAQGKPYYDEKLKRWIFPGDVPAEVGKPLAPPPSIAKKEEDIPKPEEPKDPFVTMFDRINKDVSSLPYYDGLTEEEKKNFYARYVSNTTKWLNDLETELEQTFNGKERMPFDDAWDNRAGTISFNVSNVMLEAAAEASFPNHMYTNKKVQRMLYLIQYGCGVSNEMASFAKDLADYDVHPRLTCTMEEKGLDSYKDLLLCMASMYNEGIEEFDSLYNELLSDGCLDDEKSIKYVSHLRQYQMGATYWFMNARRYSKWVLVDHDEQCYFDLACANTSECDEGVKLSSITATYPRIVG